MRKGHSRNYRIELEVAPNEFHFHSSCQSVYDGASIGELPTSRVTNLREPHEIRASRDSSVTLIWPRFSSLSNNFQLVSLFKWPFQQITEFCINRLLSNPCHPRQRLFVHRETGLRGLQDYIFCFFDFLYTVTMLNEIILRASPTPDQHKFRTPINSRNQLRYLDT